MNRCMKPSSEKYKYLIIVLLCIIGLMTYMCYIYFDINIRTIFNETFFSNKNEYITVEPIGGLCNKLRVILHYLYIANINNQKLRVIWIKTKTCPGRFDSLFEDISNVEIIYENPEDINIDYSGYSGEIKNNYIQLLIPKQNIQVQIDDTLKLLNKDFIACHIRRTDIITNEKYLDKMKSDQEYVNFINQCPDNLKIYIATDNKETQDIFINIYGDRIILKKIEPNDNYRQTTLEDTVSDIFVSGNAKYFMGSYSSVTDTIKYIIKIKNQNVLHPTPIIIDNISRKLPSEIDENLPNEELNNYDYKTLFYDCWIYDNKLTCIGHKLESLYDDLFPLKITINNKEYSYELYNQINKCTFLTINNIDKPSNNIYHILIETNSSNLMRFSLILTEIKPLLQESILVTLQKNNKIQWIKDWVNYYLKNYVDAIIIYDNNSLNYDEIVNTFKDNDKVYIHSWNFPYGIGTDILKTVINPDKIYNYCQRGALNHAKLKHCNNSYLYNFDIDEIIVYNKNNVINNLKTYDCLQFNSYSVLVFNENLDTDYSFSIFKYRNDDINSKYQKWIINCKKVGYVHPHGTESKNKLEIDISKGYFLHYMGITTNWKYARLNWKYDRFKPSNNNDIELINLNLFD